MEKSVKSSFLDLLILYIISVSAGPKTKSIAATSFNPCKPPEAVKKGCGYQKFSKIKTNIEKTNRLIRKCNKQAVYLLRIINVTMFYYFCKQASCEF